jgi:hypothetical protein
MALFYVLTVILIVLLFILHRHKLGKFSIPSQLESEMNTSILYLTFASATYIMSNFATTYIQLMAAVAECLEPNCISDITFKYQWLFLLSFFDPIIHPIILIRRIRSISNIHRKLMTNFSWTSVFEISASSSTIRKKPRFEKKAQKFNTDYHISSANKRSTKISSELQSILNRLEMEQHGKY